MAENNYQAKLIKKLGRRFPDCIVLKNDTSYQQGMPDLIVIDGPIWGFLEVKDSALSPLQPNQQYWVDHLNNMSFAAIIYPENEKEVLDALQQAFESPWRACVSES